jgi:hypothetical protein
MRKYDSTKRSIVVLGMIAMCSGYILTDPVVNRLELAMNDEEYLLIDDFSRANGESMLGTNWEMFTDQVMGGVSTGSFSFEEIDGRRCIHLRGSVSLENRGGFIQVALPLELNKKPINATDYDGVRILVRGNGERYFIHFRTGRTLLPWQYYQADFIAKEEWQIIEISFNSFQPERLKGAFNPKRLKRIAIVAAEKAYQADVAVAQLDFYRTSSEK